MGTSRRSTVAADRRSSGSFSSLLSGADYNAALAAGLEPVGIVQGRCVLHWAFYGPGSPYGGALPVGSGSRRLKRRYYEQGRGTTFGAPRRLGLVGRQREPETRLRPSFVRPIVYASGSWTDWPCPHSSAGGHHDPGVNFAQPWVEDLWLQGYTTARERMLGDAARMGAHGVVGVVNEVATPRRRVREFVLRGTAVRVRKAPVPDAIWSTYLVGERLNRVVEAGWAPISVVGALGSVRIWSSCTTKAQRAGGLRGASEMRQLEAAYTAVTERARARLRGECGNDEVHGAHVETDERRIAAEDDEVRCHIVGSRLRRYARGLPPEKALLATVSLR